jgi:hypothetical protein
MSARSRARTVQVFAAMCAAAVCAQEPVIRTTVPLILVPTTVTDTRGKTVDGLSELDFDVF